jgi:hypothetical protein
MAEILPEWRKRWGRRSEKLQTLGKSNKYTYLCPLFSRARGFTRKAKAQEIMFNY